MAATKEKIRKWLEGGNPRFISHMIVVCDTFDHNDYPVYISKSEDVNERVAKIKAQEMTRIMEVYSYSIDLEEQLNESRVFNY